MDENRCGSVVKWAGGKSKLAKVIEEEILKTVDIDKIDTYVEPFFGGGSFFFYMNQKYQFKNKIIADINFELINLYKVIQQKPDKIMSYMDVLQNDYNKLDNLELKSAYFYAIRDDYNKSIMAGVQSELDVIQAAYFLFLNKVGFNGLYRVNMKGLYNVPFGKKETATLYKKSNILGVSRLLADVIILNCSYEGTIDYANENTLFYLDPPYRPLSNSSSFTSYAKSNFNDSNQKELAHFIDNIDMLESKFALSNSDPKNQDAEDNFFDDLYSNYNIRRIFANRSIGAKSNSRGKVSEILVTN